MKRRRIISVSVIVALVCAVAPVSLSGWVAWRNALRHERREMDHLAELTIRRAQGAFAEAHRTLSAMHDAAPAPCSPAHLALMRSQVLGSHYLHEIGYFEDGQLRCTSWGVVEGSVRQLAADYLSDDGMAVSTRLRPLANPGQTIMALQLGRYNALVNPSTLTDMIVAPDVQLAIASDRGHPLSSTGPNARRWLAGEHDQDSMHGSARAPGWYAVATQPHAALQATLREEQLRWLPIGVVVSLLLVGAVVWISRQRLSPLARLQLAVQRREFVVHYQPIIALADGHCAAAEALVRWQQPDGTLLAPDQFIPLAERSGLVQPITDQVLQRVIEDLGQLLRDAPDLHVAINVYAEDIRSGRIHALLESQLRHTGIAPDQIWIEATERSLIDIEAARGTIVQLRERGHAVAIDDFGTGYSNLQYLQGLPLDALKIDRSFVETIGMESATSSVTAHIIDMARALGLQIVAEGVERQEQFDYLRAHGVQYGQGWLFSKALSAQDFIAYRARTRPRGRS